METNETVTQGTVTVRRAPRYGRFMIVAIVLFAIVALILTYSFPAEKGYDRSQVFGYMLIIAIVAGIVAGGAVALLVDRLATRRARTVVADRLDGHGVGSDTSDAGAMSDFHDPAQNQNES